MKYWTSIAFFLLFVGVLIMLASGVIGCTVASPDAGQEAVLVEKPWIFGHGGVDRDPIKTGLTYAAITTSAVYVDMRPQQFKLHFDDFMSKDGVPLDFDAVLRLRVVQSVELIERFGPHWYSQNVEAEFTNRVRQAVRKHGMNEMAINTLAIDAVDSEVTQELERYIQSARLPVQLIQVTVGKANPPDSVKNQRIETATQQQRQFTETERMAAENNRKGAEVSRAAADNAYRNALGLSSEQFIALENIQMQRKVCVSASCTFVIGQVMPTLTVGRGRDTVMH